MSDKPTSFRASELSESEREEAARLRARFSAYKASGKTQKEFAALFDMPGGASVITQHIKGMRPISLEQAKAYMRGFNCSLEDISPSLAAKWDADSSKFEKDIQLKGDQIMNTLAKIKPERRGDAYSKALEALIPYLIDAD